MSAGANRDALLALMDRELACVAAVPDHDLFPGLKRWLLDETCILLEVEKGDLLAHTDPNDGGRGIDVMLIDGARVIRDVLYEPGLVLALLRSETDLGFRFSDLFADALVNLRKYGTAEEPKRVVRGVPVLERPDGALEPVPGAPETKRQINQALADVFRETAMEGVFPPPGGDQ